MSNNISEKVRSFLKFLLRSHSSIAYALLPRNFIVNIRIVNDVGVRTVETIAYANTGSIWSGPDKGHCAEPVWRNSRAYDSGPRGPAFETLCTGFTPRKGNLSALCGFFPLGKEIYRHC